MAHKKNVSRENFWFLKQVKLQKDCPEGRRFFPSTGLHPDSSYPGLNAFTLPVYLTSFAVNMFLVKCHHCHSPLGSSLCKWGNNGVRCMGFHFSSLRVQPCPGALAGNCTQVGV